MATIDYIAVAVFSVGVGLFLVTYLPFSPMTIDIVNLRRESQLNIFRYRKPLWLIAALCLASVMLASLTYALSIEWFWIGLVASMTLFFMFWSGYVPWVMTAPSGQRIVDVEQADQLLHSDDTVLGLFHGGRARAYPRDLIARPHFLTDTIASTPMIVSYCILCNSAVAFVSELNGWPLDLDCVTAFNNNIIYRDKRTGNIIQQLDGAVIEGPDKGLKLESLPLTVMSWSDWRALHPETTVCYCPAVSLRDKMMARMLGFLIPISKLSKRTKPWHRVRGKLDPRLPAMSYVFGVEIGQEQCAYPETFLREHPAHNDVVGGQAIVVFYNIAGGYGNVFCRLVDGNVVEFETSKSVEFGDAFTDKATRSV